MPAPRSRPRLGRLLGAAFGVTALGLVAVACDDNDPPATAEPITPPTTPVPSPPRSLIAATRDNRVVTVDPATGAVLDELITADDLVAGAWIMDHRTVLARGIDGDVYVEVEIPYSGEPKPRIYRLPADGGAPEFVTEGFAPAISPDGETLAYARGNFESEVVLRDLATDEERVIAAAIDSPGEEFPDPVAGLRFSPDGTELAVTWTYEGSYAGIVDVAAASLAEERRLAAGSAGCLGQSAWLGADRLAIAVETSFPYCGADSEEAPSVGRLAVFEHDAEDAAKAIPLPTFARSLAVDGDTFAVVTFDDVLLRIENGTATPIGAGFTQVIW
jgi:hypothetical protein